MPTSSVVERRIRLSALLLLAAFVVEVLSLLWRHPLSFFLFLIVGGLLALVGIGTFLLSLVSSETRPLP